MIDEGSKQRILDFMGKHKLTVISTVDIENNKPEAACIAFAEKENLDIIFGTSSTSRKYQNLQRNQNVSFVIGWSDELGTIQYEGVATELSGEEAMEHGKVMADKNENARVFLTKKSQRYFLVKPTWIRLVDKIKQPEEKLEFDFTGKAIESIKDAVLLLNINETYREGMTEEQVLGVAYRAWRVDATRKDKAEYALAVYQDEVKGVFKINSWLRDVEETHKWAFMGEIAPEPIRSKYIGMKGLRWEQGYRESFIYVNC